MTESPREGGAAAAGAPAKDVERRHALLVRVTHWITSVCFLALLVTGIEILISHPRFYWGETGNVNTPAWLVLPIPSSRSAIRSGYGYVLPDQNGWSRALHFEAAWVVVLAGLVYAGFGLFRGHFRRELWPAAPDRSLKRVAATLAGHLRFWRRHVDDASTYNVIQRLSYLLVIFVLFPLEIWTGLAMSPAIESVFPWAVILLGGRQSARTLHFLDSIALVIFVLVHVGMVARSGFRQRVGAMITGRLRGRGEGA